MIHFHDGLLQAVKAANLFDYMFCSYRINFKGNKELYASGFCSDDECWRLYEEKIHAILSKGLNDRAKFIRVIWRNAECQWSVNDVWFQA